MIQITKFFLELFLNRMQECALIYFVCNTVSALDICGAQQSMWHPGKRDGPLVHPLYVYLPYHLFNIHFMNQWCPTKVQNDDCVSLCSLLGASYPTSFPKSMSAATPEIVLRFSKIIRVSTWLLSIRQFAASWNKYWIKGIPRGYAIRSGRHPEGSQRPQGRPQVGPGRWLPEGCLPDRIA